MTRIFRTIDAGLDRAIGADRLTDGIRARLLTEQIDALRQNTPAVVAASFVISLALVGLSYNTPVFGSILGWATILQLFLLVGYVIARARAKATLTRPTDRRLVRGAALHAVVFGIMWGIVPLIGLPGGDPAVKVSVMISIACMLYVSGVALAPLPQASLAFALPVLLGAFCSIATLDRLSETLFLAALISAYFVAAMAIALHSVRGFVRNVELESRVRSQRDVIGLLLKEFNQKGSDWLWALDSQGLIEDASERFSPATSKRGAKLIGNSFIDYLRGTGEDNIAQVRDIEQSIQARKPFINVQIKVQRGAAETWWLLTGKPAVDEFGAYSGYIGTASEITAEKLAEKRINYLAHHDALTGMLNRAKFTDLLKQCVAKLERHGLPFAVMFLDLDRFKAVNDNFGHLIGDKLLVEVSRRIRASIRETDIVARLGGDEFAIILNNNCDTEQAAALAARLINAVGQHYDIDHETVTIGISVGIAIAPINGVSPDQLLRKADLSLYRAKADGRGVYRFFEHQMDDDVQRRRQVENELAEALSNGELALYYQPQVAPDTRRPTGFEALLRWNHPARGTVGPGEFLAMAEQCGLIGRIGDWTIHEACHAAARWPGDLSVAVNLSPRHFWASDIAGVIREALANSGLAARRLEIDVTEDLLMDKPQQAMERLRQIKALDVTIALDDFGTGFSSLSQLLKFPIGKIRTDRSLVEASSNDPVARNTLLTIASLGRSLDIDVTAKGVETPEQMEFLNDIGVGRLQGFYFSAPLSESDLAAYFLRDFEREALSSNPEDAGRSLSGN